MNTKSRGSNEILVNSYLTDRNVAKLCTQEKLQKLGTIFEKKIASADQKGLLIED